VMFFCLSLGMWDPVGEKSGCKGNVFFRNCKVIGEKLFLVNRFLWIIFAGTESL